MKDPITIDPKFRFRLDRRARWLTLATLLLVGTLVGLLFYLSGASYLPAWFATIVVVLLLLASLSIPRFMRVSPHSVEIHCVMELIKIPLSDIRHIRFVEPRQMRYCIPLWGVYGFGGYYGFYLNLRERRLFRLCASRWSGFVLIEDIYEEQYIISCDDPAAVIRAVEQYE